MHKNILIILLITFVISIPLVSLFTNVNSASQDDSINNNWQYYKQTFIDPDGAVRRRDQGNDVVSEGVAYTLLRSVWQDDQATFDLVYTWAEQNLSRKNNPDLGDNLLAWKWSDQVQDWGAASDADLDYALALSLADKRWGSNVQENDYKQKSLAVQEDILTLETGWIGDKVYLQPGSWNSFEAPIPVNPSYLSPAHYKIFNQMKPDARWLKLVDSAYDIAWKSSSQIDNSVGIGLPADWVEVQSDNSIKKHPNLGIDYKYDAIRTGYRFALDYIWNNDLRAKNYLMLSGAHNFFNNQIQTNQLITAEYSHTGQPISDYQNAGTLAMSLMWFIADIDQNNSKFLSSKLEDQLNNHQNKFIEQPNYYMENLAYLGYAVAKGYAKKDFPIYSSQQIIGNIKDLLAPNKQDDELKIATQSAIIQTNDNQQLSILNLQVNERLSSSFLLTAKNAAHTQTWWSVDGGGWNEMFNDQDDLYLANIDLTNWNWSPINHYIIHVWAKDISNKIYHSQIEVQVY